MPRRSPYVVLLSEKERVDLERMAGQYTLPYYKVIRSKIVLLAAEGLSNKIIAQRLDVPRPIVSKWRKRFFEERLSGLEDRSRPGRPPGFPPLRWSFRSRRWRVNYRARAGYRSRGSAVPRLPPRQCKGASLPRSAAPLSGAG